ncbi:MAG: ELWxxDGT repeat protein, partial [Candidatus Thermoplasmatota archaeon]|nr:ELWxxDGT repeat protein [Candidatus Thermoplasmatota archaeon]
MAASLQAELDDALADLSEANTQISLLESQWANANQTIAQLAAGWTGANSTIASMLSTYSSVMLSDIAELNYSPYCQGISKELSQGLDNGDGNGTAADGQLHDDEVDSIDQICPKIHMLTEIYSQSNQGYPSRLAEVGGTLFFTAYDETNGYELWKSDGTTLGTVMVKDINSGSSNSLPMYLTAVGNTLFFEANDGYNGRALWKSDGSASGTVLVADPYVSSDSASPLDMLTAVGNTLFFRAYTTTEGVELWKSDGTSSGTVMVKDINSGSGSSNPAKFTAVGSTIY